jgi:hypothetical protein
MPISLPATRYLLAIGFHHVRQVGRYGWLYAANVSLGLLDTVTRGYAADLLLAIASTLVLLIAIRQILTGNLEVVLRDLKAVLRFVWFLFLLMMPALTVGILLVLVLTFGVGAGRGATYAIIPLMGLAIAYLAVRGAFLIPALAVGDATGVRISFAQTQALWPTLFALALVTGAPVLLLGLILPALGLPLFVGAVLTSAIGTAGLLLSQAPICWLYARITGRDASGIAP